MAATRFTPQFQHRNLPAQIADHIVLLIASGELVPGGRLFEKDICERLSISRIPVREAFRILQAQGVLRAEPNRGSFITELGSQEISEMMEMRLAVERIALRHLLARVAGDPSIVAELQLCVDDMTRAIRADDRLAFCQADLSFHNKIIELSASPLLAPIWNSLSRGVLMFLMQERDIKRSYANSVKDHERLIGLIQARKKAELDREIERHIMSSLRTQKTKDRRAVERAAKREADAR